MVIQIDVHPCLVCVWFLTIRISCDQRIITFHVVLNRFEHIHYPREEELPTQSTIRWLTGSRVHTQLLSHNSKWSSGEKTSFCWQPTTRLTGPISPACDWYVQYLLAEDNPSVLNRHRHGLQPWRCRLFTSHFLTFPTDGHSLSTWRPRLVSGYPYST
jgi:hypothetical protein